MLFMLVMQSAQKRMNDNFQEHLHGSKLFKEVTQRFAHLKLLSPNFSSSPFVICVNLLHPCSFMAYDLFDVFYLITQLFSGFLQIKGSFVCGQSNFLKIL